MGAVHPQFDAAQRLGGVAVPDALQHQKYIILAHARARNPDGLIAAFPLAVHGFQLQKALRVVGVVSELHLAVNALRAHHLAQKQIVMLHMPLLGSYKDWAQQGNLPRCAQCVSKDH